MTATTTDQFSVFLSFPVADRAFAEQVASALRDSGLEVVSTHDVEPGGDYTNDVRRALAGSKAVVVALTNISKRQEIPASVLFEVGAAVGADKPIFIVLDQASASLP